jgi:hypothetical protein
LVAVVPVLAAVVVLPPPSSLLLPHAASVPAAATAARVSAMPLARAPPNRARARLMVLTQRIAFSSSALFGALVRAPGSLR